MGYRAAIIEANIQGGTPAQAQSADPVGWIGQLLEGAAGVFELEGHSEPAEPAIDVKTLHAKIGELTLVNDFLSGTLGKAGLLPSAKR